MTAAKALKNARLNANQIGMKYTHYLIVCTGRIGECDFISADGRWAIEVKTALHGARDLHAAALQLAIYLGSAAPRVKALLLVNAPRIGRERLATEWSKVERALHPELARRMGLVAFGSNGVVVVPEQDEVVQKVCRATSALFAPVPGERSEPVHVSAAWDRKRFEVWKVLFDAWLRKEPPLPIGELGRRAPPDGDEHPGAPRGEERGRAHPLATGRLDGHAPSHAR